LYIATRSERRRFVASACEGINATAVASTSNEKISVFFMRNVLVVFSVMQLCEG
jgi:hypothetical protein